MKFGGQTNSQVQIDLQRPAAEALYADELQKLKSHDAGRPRPGGWLLTPRSVLSFVLGDKAAGTSPKFVGSRSLIERCIVALATNRGLMLIGEPGTAKSYLSELLSSAISGDSTLTIQGSAGTTEDNIKYSWNYALLLSEGPTERALISAPLFDGMRHGKIVRFEEITRCPIEIQDSLLSVLSERVLTIPERDDDGKMLYAKVGFNVIATANTRDRGVNEMSAALKRRFNFETVPPIADIESEMNLVQRETTKLLSRASVPFTLPPDLVELLTTTFHELRLGKTSSGHPLEPLSAVMSTAEAVGVGYSAGVHAYYYGNGHVEPDHLIQSLLGSSIKDDPNDIQKLKYYFRHSAADRSGAAWRAYGEAARKLL